MVALAGTIVLSTSDGNFDLWTTMVGIALVLVLHAYDPEDDADWWSRSAAFSAVWALCVVLIAGFFLDFLSNEDAADVACWVVLMAGMTLYRRYRIHKRRSENEL